MSLRRSSEERRRRQIRKRGRGQGMQGLVGHDKESGIHVLEWLCSKSYDTIYIFKRSI